MRYREFALLEAVDQTLIQDAYAEMRRVIKGFTKTRFRPLYDRADPEAKAEYDALEADYSEAASNRQYQLRERMITAFEQQIEAPDPAVLDDAKALIEETLQRLARKYIEAKHGEIGLTEPGQDYDSIKQKHLYWLHHIVVQLRLDSRRRSGEMRTGTGHYDKSLPVSDYDTRYVQNHQPRIARDELAVGITIDATSEALWTMLRQLLLIEAQEATGGEASRNEREVFNDFFQPVLATFIHEVVHLDQHTRDHQAWQKKRHRHTSPFNLSYLPQPGKKRARISRMSGDKRHAGKRIGKRGDPALGDTWNAEAFVEYLGSPHEIEAHAAGAASAIISDFLLDNDDAHHTRDGVSRQIAVNEYVAGTIDDLKRGYAINHQSYESYRDYIRAKIDTAGEATGVHNPRLIRYVWRMFMRRLVRHLQAHIKPIEWDDVPEDDYRDWRRAYHPEPRPARHGRIVHPATKPNLP